MARLRGLVLVMFGAVGMTSACAPIVDGPVDHQRARDRNDETRLAAQLELLPGARHARVTIQRPVMDPLMPSPTPGPATGSVVIVVETEADRARITDRTRALVHAVAPEVADPTIDVEVDRPPPRLARVGPFTVEEGSRTPLRIALAIAFLVIAALGVGLARNAQRRGNNAQ
ncbi:MAG: hypothetical protein NT062_14985 [Proteobacteria bacterium]|nr:hypothetical protein [Pseudomonadota bacterium]